MYAEHGTLVAEVQQTLSLGGRDGGQEALHALQSHADAAQDSLACQATCADSATVDLMYVKAGDASWVGRLFSVAFQDDVERP